MDRFNLKLKGNIASKLKKSYIIIIGAMTVCILASIVLLLKMRGDYENCIQTSGYSQGYLGQLGIEFNTMTSNLRSVILEEDDASISSLITSLDENKNNVDKYIEIVKELAIDDKEFTLLDEIDLYLDKYNEIKEEVILLAENNKNDEAYELLKGDGVTTGVIVRNNINELLEINITQCQETMSSVRLLSYILIIAILIMLCICVFIGFRLSASMASLIVNPLEEVRVASEKIKNGNLEIDIKFNSDDEIGNLARAFKETCVMLRKIIRDIGFILGELAQGNFAVTLDNKSAYVGEFEEIINNVNNLRNTMSGTLFNIQQIADQVSNGAEQMSMSAQNLAEGSTDQAGAVEELVATVETVNTIVSKNTETAKESFEQANGVVIEAEESKKVMIELSEAMTSINETSKKIGNIIAEIEDIASQTNLLSLNATIEAARAGDAGRGFAVVADQISKLATESSKSAVNTRELIINSMAEIEKGNKLTERTSAVLNHVISGVKEIGENAKQNRQSAIEQADAINQIKDGIEQISSVIQTNSATAQENSATSEELSAQSENLSSEINKFRLL